MAEPLELCTLVANFMMGTSYAPGEEGIHDMLG